MGLNKMETGFKRGIEMYVTERMPHTNSEEKGWELSFQGIVQL